MTHQSDIDIDFANREDILQHIKHIAGRKTTLGKPDRHNSGVYVQPIPYDPMLDAAALNYKEADARGYFKIDFLNVSVYQHIKDAAHYEELLAREPPWHRLDEMAFVEQLIHVANYPYKISQAKPSSIAQMAMFIAALRPAKKHLLGKSWKEIGETIWEKPTDGSYSFRHSHAIAYAMLVALHMNIIDTMG